MVWVVAAVDSLSIAEMVFPSSATLCLPGNSFRPSKTLALVIVSICFPFALPRGPSPSAQPPVRRKLAVVVLDAVGEVVERVLVQFHAAGIGVRLELIEGGFEQARDDAAHVLALML